MKISLLVTFDFTQRGKSGTGLAAGSLIAACEAHPDYNNKFVIEHLPINSDDKNIDVEEIAELINNQIPIDTLDSIGLGCYCWSSIAIEPLIAQCKKIGFTGKFILGGPEVHDKTCRKKYPNGDIYISGNAEISLPKAILMNDIPLMGVLHDMVDVNILPSPFLTNVINISQNQEMIHWETARGCKFKCNFCAHTDLQDGGVSYFNLLRIKKELDLFKEKNVQKINVLDPIFNYSPKRHTHIDILEYAIEIGLTSLLCFQVRLEILNAKELGDKFLKLCKQLNVHLEFGIQTPNIEEAEIITRPFKEPSVVDAIKKVIKSKIPFEVSLIYGLPMQTPTSFNESIQFLKDHGVLIIKAFPLMILDGTALAKDENIKKYDIQQDVLEESPIPHVVACKSFTRADYVLMQQRSKEADITQ
jgi:radical SAM superfamily enzyme YgiQ (UPF0313 family)